MTPAELASHLTTLGVRPGALLMVHASLRKLGPVDGGAAGVVAAIDQAVGPDGTWMMTVYPEEGEVFDYLTTPASNDIGVLAEVFRQQPGTVVTNHPEGRMGARGPLAEMLVQKMPWNDYYGTGSPLERFVERGGQVLRLGADLDTVTVIHYAEYLADLPNKVRVTRRRTMMTPDGPQEVAVECLDDEFGIIERREGTEDYFATILSAYIASGAGMAAQIGGARCELLDGAELVTFAAHWMETNLSAT